MLHLGKVKAVVEPHHAGIPLSVRLYLRSTLGIFWIAAKATASQSFAPWAVGDVLKIRSINLNIMCWPGPPLSQLWNMILLNVTPAGMAQGWGCFSNVSVAWPVGKDIWDLHMYQLPKGKRGEEESKLVGVWCNHWQVETDGWMLGERLSILMLAF